MAASDDDKPVPARLPRPSSASGLRSRAGRSPSGRDDAEPPGSPPRRPAAPQPVAPPPPAEPPQVTIPVEASPAEPERMSLLGLDFVQDDEVSVLLVGSEHPMLSAISRALEQHGVHVEESSADAMLDAVVAATPSLVLLVGDAARRGGEAPLRQLRWRGFGSSIPTAVLMEGPTTHHRLQALANGATAVIHQSASVDAIAQEVVEAARNAGETAGRSTSIGSTTLSDLLDALGKRVIADLLPTDDTETTSFGEVRLGLGAEGEIAALVERFSAELREHVSDVERFEYALSSRASTAEILGDDALAEAASAGEIPGLRVILADSDPARADAVAQTLRDAGALVIVTGLSPADERFQQLRQFDPAVLLIGAEDLGQAARLVEGMEEDRRLRWASMLVIDWTDVYRPGGGAPDVNALFGRLAALGEQEKALRARAEMGSGFDTRIEVVGPARTLRALTEVPRPLRVTVHHPRATVRIDLSEGLVVGATAQLRGEPPQDLEGSAALAVLLALRSGRVEVQAVGQAAAVNLMSTVDNALSVADGESVPFRRSEFPSSDRPLSRGGRRRDAPAGGEELADATAGGIILRLRSLLGRSALIGGASVPLWVLASGAVLWALVISAVVAGARSEDEPTVVAEAAHEGAVDRAPEASPPASPAGQPSAVPAPAEPASAASQLAQPSLLQRVRQGDRAAIAELEARPADQRTVEETLALREGKVALARAEVAKLREKLRDNPALVDDREIQKRLIELSRDERTAPVALELAASLPGPPSADLIYEVWVGTTESTPATALARELVYTKAVRDKASSALGVALDLRATETCPELVPIVERALAEGDERSLHLLARLAAGSLCRPGKKCYPCLRGSRVLTDAITAVQDRAAPEF